MYATFIATVVLLCACTAHSTEAGGYTGGNYSPPGLPGYTLEWKPMPTSGNDLLEIRITAPTTGWVGFGLAEWGAGGMPGSDFVVCHPPTDAAVASAIDYHGLTYGTPTLDVSQDWTLVSVTATADTAETVCELSRLLDTGDTQDRPIDLARLALGDAPVLFAHGASGDTSFGYHGAAVTTASLNFLNPTNATAEILALTE